MASADSRRRAAGGLVLALVLALVAFLPTTSVQAADKGTRKETTVSVRLAPATVTVFDDGTVEPTGVVVQVEPARAGRKVVIERNDGGSWTTLQTTATDATGRVWMPIEDVELGPSVQYRTRVLATATYTSTDWRTARLRTVDNNGGCKPAYPPIIRDITGHEPTGEAYCLLARLDRWQKSGLMAVGQQLNISSQDHWDDPLQGIDAPAVIGFDLEELDQAVGFGYGDDQVKHLMDLAHGGAVLVASWHTTNPFTGEPFNSDRHAIKPILNQGTAAGDVFWADFFAKMALLKRFQDGDIDGDGTPDEGGYRTSVVFRPFHEVNGGFFWWGKPNAADYLQLWSNMISRSAGEGGVYNLIWAYSGNRDTSTTTDPAMYTPYAVDIGALDTYDPEQGKGNAVDALGLEGYGAIARSQFGKVHRMALTEVGPHGSADQDWNPAVITRTVKRAKIKPLWSMLWFDDGTPAQAKANGVSGYKQLNSLRGGKGWLSGCFNSLCYLR